MVGLQVGLGTGLRSAAYRDSSRQASWHCRRPFEARQYGDQHWRTDAAGRPARYARRRAQRDGRSGTGCPSLLATNATAEAGGRLLVGHDRPFGKLIRDAVTSRDSGVDTASCESHRRVLSAPTYCAQAVYVREEQDTRHNSYLCSLPADGLLGGGYEPDRAKKNGEGGANHGDSSQRQ